MRLRAIAAYNGVMQASDSAWLAGFLDGEGSFMIWRRQRGGYDSWSAAVAVTSTDDRLLLRCMAIAGGKLSALVQPKGNAKPARIWTVMGKRLTLLLEAVLPHLVGKREQAEIVLTLRRETRAGALPGNEGVRTDHEKNARREIMRLAVRALNHRGTVPMPAEQLAALAVWRTSRTAVPPGQFAS